MTKFYKVVLRDRVFWKESARDYQAVYAEMCKKYGSNLKAVYVEDGINSLEDLKRVYSNK